MRTVEHTTKPSKLRVHSKPAAIDLVTPDIVQLQAEPISQLDSCACGGGCPRCAPLQTKLTIGTSDDIYEREADRIANRVMRMPLIQRQLEGQIENACVGSEGKVGNQTVQPMLAGPIIQPQLNAPRSDNRPQQDTDGMHERIGMAAGPQANSGFAIETETNPCVRTLRNCLHQVEVDYRKDVANCRRRYRKRPSDLEICLAMARNSKNFYAAYCWANYWDCVLN